MSALLKNLGDRALLKVSWILGKSEAMLSSNLAHLVDQREGHRPNPIVYLCLGSRTPNFRRLHRTSMDRRDPPHTPLVIARVREHRELADLRKYLPEIALEHPGKSLGFLG